VSYPGGKAGAGVYQTIINAMPPHDCYIEACVGGGAILLRKKPAFCSIAIDADARVARRWSTIAKRGDIPRLRVRHGDARSIIAELDEARSPRTLIYCDPPYVLSTRRSQARIYRHEMTEGQHRRLLSLLVTLPCAVMVSGYRHALYDYLLADWRRIDFTAPTRGGPAIESLWMNFDPQARLHDYSYLGRTFRERERIKRKTARWVARINALPELERRALVRAMLEESSLKVAMVASGRPSSPKSAMAAEAPAASSKMARGSAPARIARIGDAGSRIVRAGGARA